MSSQRAEHAAQEQPATSRCSSCRAVVVWVVTTKGKPMPLDAVPVPTGNVRFTGETRRAQGRPGTVGREGPEVEYVEASSLFVDPTDEDRYVSHFVTCPDAGAWRSRKGRAS